MPAKIDVVEPGRWSARKIDTFERGGWRARKFEKRVALHVNVLSYVVHDEFIYELTAAVRDSIVERLGFLRCDYSPATLLMFCIALLFIPAFDFFAPKLSISSWLCRFRCRAAPAPLPHAS